jgi:hypothetical protein
MTTTLHRPLTFQCLSNNQQQLSILINDLIQSINETWNANWRNVKWLSALL